ncbi:TPA: rRNA pseudouridine synthase [Candidatus Woesearchaeota archaeon]|nr:pseudouridine synthase [archaeon]HIJ10990.1 rRNA pseudouridine synthase [Candidatus Woesearchaeota archaeon]|tara:strand:+ start:648 stop:1325 length:678 start_codon:yes stop_codon:yes gene_type:complete
MHRVQKLLSNYGFCSRRKAEELIEDGLVKVNGVTITLGDKANEDDEITVRGKLVSKPRKVYIMFHKPIHCVTALKDDQHKTVMQYINIKERIFPIGRLDYNTTGMLLLTNDGDFANNIMHPSKEVKKTYRVEASRLLTNLELKQLRKGVILDDGPTRGAVVNKVGEFEYEVIIHEGRNRIIRRMFDVFDVKVRKLRRVGTGKLELGSLELGRWRHLTKKEIKEFV